MWSNGMIRCIGRRWYSLQNSSAVAATAKAVHQLTVKDIMAKYHRRNPISMVTAYDYITASWAQNANSDMILVGDSVAMCSLGYESTTQLSLDEFQYHVGAVCRAPGPAFVVVDMPFGSFERSISDGIGNAFQLLHLNPKVQAVKVECGLSQDDYSLEYIKELVRRGISVIGHIGLTPQRVHSLGGYKAQGGQQSTDAVALYNVSQTLQQIGCFGIVLECIPHKISSVITDKLHIPTIGIGAGPDTSGQVLVQSDVLGMLPGHKPKFVKMFADFKKDAVSALSQYVQEVHDKSFPHIGHHTFKVNDEVYQDFISKIDTE
ncbi:3-methyl-2-oxobutanoate hydroxymethyltransferase [Kluyveromyces lactis]|uniref:3-methyl-2-oxobutanoate hydroxymethyltransferase n=1 Tax=Kluyveromyces lactis (strain ATCC 8585 / CBS 2359 / DSM 70799 / NBRC 1267 / NRRL Y-1140 / WM37) TaxID=284590 RepID=Q6CLY9_KLULA|nr:uncharacterized protein KLLA0_E24399g [Kluyveromyces lactis]CAH00137.1 KLLA0E24399p [Kluyveromyces lactis]|eukprot:XP_455050.1 uncharacterized protein KLLA0_E24399g [Kluyveromyces lactis]